MLFFKSFALFLLLWCAHLTLAEVLIPAQCPKVKVIEHFDLLRYMGTWYKYLRYPVIYDSRTCMNVGYAYFGDDTVSAVYVALDRFTGRSLIETSMAKVIAPGQWEMRMSKNQNAEKQIYIVLGTDYTSFSVVYSCSDSKLTSSAAQMEINKIWVLTRQRKPDEATIQAAKHVLAENNLSRKPFQKVLQNNCSVTKSNSKGRFRVKRLDESGDDKYLSANTHRVKPPNTGKMATKITTKNTRKITTKSTTARTTARTTANTTPMTTATTTESATESVEIIPVQPTEQTMWMCAIGTDICISKEDYDNRD